MTEIGIGSLAIGLDHPMASQKDDEQVVGLDITRELCGERFQGCLPLLPRDTGIEQQCVGSELVELQGAAR
jgi:hypothetical protein